MATRSRAQLTKAPGPATPRRESSAQENYVAKVVSRRELCHFIHAQGGGEPAVAWIAARQLGVVTTWQLRAAGWGRGMVSRRLASGRLTHLHRGVYAVGRPLLPGARELAAVLACGADAVVSHRSAAVLWGLTTVPPAEVEVSVVAKNRKSRRGVRVHRLSTLDARDRTERNGIPVTSPARTLIDFAASASADDLEWALAQARAMRLVGDWELSAALGRAANHPGMVAVRAALKREGGPRLTRSEAERLLLRLIRDAKLPEPQANARVAGYEVDFLWPDARVIVEVDGFAFHSHRSAFERDRTRDMVLRDAGYEVIRVTWRQIVEQPLRVVAHIARALAKSQFVA